MHEIYCKLRCFIRKLEVFIAIIQIMKKEAITNLKQIQQKISRQRQRIKQISDNKNSGLFKQNKNNEHLIIFNAKEYPFKNQHQKGNHTYKTILNSVAIEYILEKLLLLSHPNIIQIQKIAKSKPKNNSSQRDTTYYSFYYEIVPFALTYLSQNPESSIQTLSSAELCQKLVEISEYLMKEDIFYYLTPESIGVTKQGQVKVYVSPLVLTKTQNLTKAEIMGSIDQIIGWWSITSEKQLSHNKKTESMMSNSLGFSNPDLSKSKIISSLIEDQSNRIKEITFPQKMKNLEKQILNIKEKFKGNIKERQRKKSDNTLMNILQRQKEDKPLNPNFQSAQISPKANIDQPFDIHEKPSPIPSPAQPQNQAQSIQQNINCINIYNHPPKETAQNKKQKNQIKPQINTAKQTNPQNLVRFKTGPINTNQFPDDEFRHEQEDNLSVDTYEMEMDLQFEPPIIVNSQFRSSFTPKRQASECNYKPTKEVHEKLCEKKSGNQVVVATKGVTESAGPLQFKNFVQFIKPQFLAKKSNIYQDPGEYQSEKSHSISNRMPLYYKELADAGKLTASYRQNSVSFRKSHNNDSEQSLKKKQSKKYANKKNEDAMKAEFMGENPPKDNKFIKNQKSQAVFRSRIEGDVSINNKLQTALQKTKNALAILKKVRISKSPLYFTSPRGTA